MASNLFMEIQADGCKGNATEDGHKEWIELLSFSTGLSASHGGTHAGDKFAAGKAHFQDFSTVTVMDSTSPALALLCANGTPIKQIEVHLVRAAKKNVVYAKYLFKHCFVSSVSTGGSGGNELPTENHTFTFNEIEWTFTPLNEDGSAGGDIKKKWNLETQTGG